MASICDDVVIGAGAVVTKDITEPGIYAGVPAKFVRTIKKEQALTYSPLPKIQGPLINLALAYNYILDSIVL